MRYFVFGLSIGRLGAFAVALALPLNLVAASSAPAAAAPTIIMKMGIATINDQQHEWLKRYKAAVEKDSNGRIDVAIYPSSQLGSIPRMIEATQFGAIQGYAGPAEFFAGIDPRFQVLGAPALFENGDQAQKTMEDPEFSKQFLALGDSKGLVGIGLFYYGENGVNTRKPVEKPSDLDDLKIRDYGGDMQAAMMKSIGCAGVPMPLDQVMPAIQQGAIDGTISVITTSAAYKSNEAAKYFAPINLSTLAVAVTVSKIWLKTLPPDLQKIVVDDGRIVSHEIHPWNQEFIKTQTAKWIAQGGVINTFTPSQLKQVHDAESHVASDVLKDKPEVKALYDLAVKTAAKYR